MMRFSDAMPTSRNLSAVADLTSGGPSGGPTPTASAQQFQLQNASAAQLMASQLDQHLLNMHMAQQRQQQQQQQQHLFKQQQQQQQLTNDHDDQDDELLDDEEFASNQRHHHTAEDEIVGAGSASGGESTRANFLMDNKNKKLFPQKLWELIHSASIQHCLRWSQDGQRVYLNRNEFERCYLKTPSNQFHTQKAISFVRQMNMYGFRKVDDCYYENDNFRRDRKHLLKNMIRRHPNKGHFEGLLRHCSGGSPAAFAAAAVAAHHHHQQQLNAFKSLGAAAAVAGSRQQQQVNVVAPVAPKTFNHHVDEHFNAPNVNCQQKIQQQQQQQQRQFNNNNNNNNLYNHRELAADFLSNLPMHLSANTSGSPIARSRSLLELDVRSMLEMQQHQQQQQQQQQQEQRNLLEYFNHHSTDGARIAGPTGPQNPAPPTHPSPYNSSGGNSVVPIAAAAYAAAAAAPLDLSKSSASNSTTGGELDDFPIEVDDDDDDEHQDDQDDDQDERIIANEDEEENDDRDNDDQHEDTQKWRRFFEDQMARIGGGVGVGAPLAGDNDEAVELRHGDNNVALKSIKRNHNDDQDDDDETENNKDKISPPPPLSEKRVKLASISDQLGAIVRSTCARHGHCQLDAAALEAVVHHTRCFLGALIGGAASSITSPSVDSTSTTSSSSSSSSSSSLSTNHSPSEPPAPTSTSTTSSSTQRHPSQGLIIMA